MVFLLPVLSYISVIIIILYHIIIFILNLLTNFTHI